MPGNGGNPGEGEPTLVVVGVPWSGHELGDAEQDAAALGMTVVVVDTPEALATIAPGVTATRLAVPAFEPDVIAAAISGLRPVCVAGITEFAMPVAAAVRERLGMPGTPELAEQTVSDKFHTRQLLQEHGLTEVECHTTAITALDASGMRFPVVIKPRSLTGSHGVRLVSQPADLALIAEPFDIGTAKRFGRDEVVVETFVPGPEISAEALVVDGTLHLWALTDKINTGKPHFHEVGHVMPSRYTADRAEQVQQYLQQVVTALGLVTSPVHAELKLLPDAVELVEIHSRFGGGRIVDLLTETFGVRPYAAYFAALRDGTWKTLPQPRGVFGTAFFTGQPGRPFSWSSFGFPNPEAVIQVDLDRRRAPKLTEYEGVRLKYWRAGHVLFGSDDYASVYDNVVFMKNQIA